MGMKRIRATGLCLVAVFAVFAVAAATAAAEAPELQPCGKAAKVGKKYTGKYTNKACSTESKTSEGKYELGVGSAQHYIIKTTSGPTFHSACKEAYVACVEYWYCKSDKDNAEYEYKGGPYIQTIIVEYKECVLKVPGKEIGCTSPGAKPGVIKTNKLHGKPVFLDKAKTKVGILISPEAGEVLEEFKCGEVAVKMRGAMLGEITGDINEATKVFTTKLETNEGRPAYLQVEETGPEISLFAEIVGLEPEPVTVLASEDGTDVGKVSKALEIRI